MAQHVGLPLRRPLLPEVEEGGQTQVGRGQRRPSHRGRGGRHRQAVGLRRVIQHLPFEIGPYRRQQLLQGDRLPGLRVQPERVVEPLSVTRGLITKTRGAPGVRLAIPCKLAASCRGADLQVLGLQHQHRPRLLGAGSSPGRSPGEEGGEPGDQRDGTEWVRRHGGTSRRV